MPVVSEVFQLERVAERSLHSLFIFPLFGFSGWTDDAPHKPAAKRLQRAASASTRPEFGTISSSAPVKDKPKLDSTLVSPVVSCSNQCVLIVAILFVGVCALCSKKVNEKEFEDKAVGVCVCLYVCNPYGFMCVCTCACVCVCVCARVCACTSRQKSEKQESYPSLQLLLQRLSTTPD